MTSLLAVLLPSALLAGVLAALPNEFWARVPVPVVHAAIAWASLFPSLAIAFVGIASRRTSALGFSLGVAFLAATCIDAAHPLGPLAVLPEWLTNPRGAKVWTWTLAHVISAAIVIVGTSTIASRSMRRAELHGQTRGASIAIAPIVAVLSIAIAATVTFAPPPRGAIVDVLNVAAGLLLFAAAVVYERAHVESGRPLWRSAAIAFLLLALAQVFYVATRERDAGATAAVHLMDLVAKGVLFAGILRDHAFLNGRERDLRRSLEGERRRLQRVLDSSADGIIVVRHDDEILLANPAAGAILGLPRGTNLQGKKMIDVLSGRLEEQTDEIRLEYGHGFLLAEALQGHPAGGILTRVSRAGTEGTEEVTLRIESRYAAMPRLPGESVDAVVITLRDVTALRELSVARASAEAIRGLLRERDEFLSVASHELKTPLTAAKVTFGSLVARANRGDSVPIDSLLRAERQVDRLTTLVEALLDVSRMQTGRLELAHERFNWIEAVQEAVRRVRSSHDDRAADLIVRLPRAAVEIVGDRSRLQQVVANLLENGIKYSRSGRVVELRVVEGADSVVTVIRDHGIGIPQEDLPDLFTRFRKAQNVRSLHYGGLGLSLYLAAEIVRRHGGTIEAESNEGAGSTFTFVLPRAAPDWRAVPKELS